MTSKKYSIAWAEKDYNGKAIKSLTPMHDAQQIHKLRLGLFVTGIVALFVAALSIIFISLFISDGSENSDYSSAIMSVTYVFAIALLIDVVFTANLNKYVNEKRWLWLYIPSLVAMILLSVPQTLVLLKLIISDLDVPSAKSWEWANYVNIACCGAFIVAETVRMVLHRNDISLKNELIKAWR